ncbi:hypothetical protein [Enterobacter hormaechei]|uniref:hypothetical protein n=1 Tax=Enterobacter cloacae complex TaxID=354276 RepID=UPI000796BCEE|nr:hypothetical protein [Enterobacter hormaechei]MDO2398883.1 hypothetical protein [Enterobacter hormaechei]MDO2404115.1 hypothetical protein [Enterobacter hormaechei]MDO2418619.1 hypothetical protein [Enterobacter hormaechei]MDO2426256.1 hypothetical protein [Enterobacter hormaechei]CZY22821.1 Uncharacterised protein [Enterobacter hormaechei]
MVAVACSLLGSGRVQTKNAKIKFMVLAMMAVCIAAVGYALLVSLTVICFKSFSMSGLVLEDWLGAM